MELFEEVSGKKYVWKLFYLLTGTPCEDDRTVEESFDGITIRKIVSTGFGLSIAKEEEYFNRCRHLHVFTKEIELALLSGDKEMYLYQNAIEGEDCIINNIDIIGKYIYITDKEICSPNPLQSKQMYTNDYFKNFKQYVMDNHTTVEKFDISFKDKVFTILYTNDKGELETIFEMSGVDIHITYPFVYFILRKLADNNEKIAKTPGFEGDFKVTRIKRKDNL